jgi:L-threonylcarbamoyladenylate synthase
MTLIFKRSELAKDFITGGQETVGVRVPQHPIALALLEEFKKIGGKGVAAPSANRFGAVSPTTAVAVEEELSEYLDEQDLILDGGPSQVGVESTIIDCTSDSPKILRLGAITREMIEAVTGVTVVDSNGTAIIRVSGSLESHYAPRARVLLDTTPIAGSGFLALSEINTPDGAFRLASPKSLEEFAHVLYESFRQADKRGLEEVVVIQPIGTGLAEAIRDRLKRAAH